MNFVEVPDVRKKRQMSGSQTVARDRSQASVSSSVEG